MEINRVRVANELGAGSGKRAKFATKVAVVTSIIIGLFFWLLIMMFHKEVGYIFTTSEAVLTEVSSLSLLLAFTILLNSVQPVLSGNVNVPLSNYLSESNFFYFFAFNFFKWIFSDRFIWFFPLTGVAVGSGWQSYVAYINLGCYYLIGVPLGFLMGWAFHQGVMVRIILSHWGSS